MRQTKDFAEVIRAKMAADPALAEAFAGESFNADLATKVYELRMKAGLTQTQLAERIGTQQSVISRIEDADYEGHSLSVLKRIAHALGAKLRVDFLVEPQVLPTTVTETVLLNWSDASGLALSKITGESWISAAELAGLSELPSGQGYLFTSSALVRR